MRSKSRSYDRPNGIKVQIVRGARMSGWYNRLDLGNGRSLTFSGSMKCSGDIPNRVVDAWWALPKSFSWNQPGVEMYSAEYDRLQKTSSEEIIRHIEAFADNMDVLWPEWNVAPDVSGLDVGARFVINMGKRRGDKEGVVKAVPAGRSKSFTVQFDGDNYLTKMPANLLQRARVI